FCMLLTVSVKLEVVEVPKFEENSPVSPALRPDPSKNVTSACVMLPLGLVAVPVRVSVLPCRLPDSAVITVLPPPVDPPVTVAVRVKLSAPAAQLPIAIK